MNPPSREGWVKENIANSSCRQTMPSRTRPPTKNQPPASTMNSAKAIAGTAATMRAPSSEPPERRGARRARCRGGGGTRSAAPVAPRATGVLGEAALERGTVEVGPQFVAHDELRVGALPQQVVAHALLAAGSDDEV